MKYSNQYIILEGLPQSVVYEKDHKSQDTEPEELFQIVVKLLSTATAEWKLLTFPSKDGTMMITETVIYINDNLVNMKFIMGMRPLGFYKSYEFTTLANHPALKLKPAQILEYTVWQTLSIHHIFDILKQRLLSGRIDEDFFPLIDKLFIQSARCGDGFIREVIAFFLFELKHHDLLHFRSQYESYSRGLGIPENFYDLIQGFSRLHAGSMKYYINYDRLKKIANMLLQLLDSLEKRNLLTTIHSFSDLGKAILPEGKNLKGYFLKWFISEQAERVNELLADTRLSLEKIERMLRTAADYYPCFISFSLQDKSFADKLVKDLEERNIACWYSSHDLKGGKKIHEQLKSAIKENDKLVLIISHNSMNSEWVKTEIANARKIEIETKKNVLVPVTLVPYDDVKEWECFDADTGKDSAREIREYYIINFQEWKHDDPYEEALAKLMDALLKSKARGV